MDYLTPLTWAAIALCLTQSAMFSGLNLAVFGISRLRLEVAASGNDRAAGLLLELRRDANFLLSTILWGNVGVNCLLTLLSDSVLAGVTAFFFSTVIITFGGEILPQAYFSRHALRMVSLFSPLLRFYQRLLYPLAKPTAKLLDWWVGEEGIEYFREQDLRKVIRKHVDADETDLDHVEGIGALNFFALDDLPVGQEGESVHPSSIVPLPVNVDLPAIPAFEASHDDPFLVQVQASGKKWVILTSHQGEPLLVLDADGFLRAVFSEQSCDPYSYCHRPIVIEDAEVPLGQVLRKLKVDAETADDDVIDQDIILVWGKMRRVITGADLLGRLLRGIVPRQRQS